MLTSILHTICKTPQHPADLLLQATQDDDRYILCREQACKAVEVPEDVLDLLADLRKHLQEESEPPVYVSDRRLVKSLALLQVR